MSQPYLFYSNRCQNSKQVIETLKALNKANLYKFILVDTLPREQIPPFLKKVPTLYVPETKETVIGNDIYGFIAKPTNSRKELPTAETRTTVDKPSNPSGEYSPWGFEGTGRLSESYSSWDSPGNFTSNGGSMYTFLDGEKMKGAVEPKTENTSDGMSPDVSARLEAMKKQRESEFAGVVRK
jgi:hypothetical protein